MRLPFTKMEGCGNDYVYVDAVAHPFPMARAGELARRWSDRHFGVGADGLIALSKDPDGALRMHMWNADGSRAEMCGNGLRCLARFATERGHAMADKFSILTDAGVREVTLLAGDDVRADMGMVTVAPPLQVEVLGVVREFTTGDAGNPHAVAFVDDVEAAPVQQVGAALQAHPDFDAGVNVEFVEVLGGDRLRQRTYERGSGETLACGTGAAVAALAARARGNIRGPAAKVELRGGALTVFGEGPDLAIVGPARTVFEGELDLQETL